MPSDSLDAGWPVVVVITDADVTRDRWLASLTDPAHGVAAISVPPEPKLVELCALTLTSTGHPFPDKVSRIQWRQVIPWLLAAAPNDIVVNHAQWLDPTQITEFIRLAAAVDARIWVVGTRQMSHRAWAAIEAWTPRTATLSWEEFTGAWHRRQQPRRPQSQPRPARPPAMMAAEPPDADAWLWPELIRGLPAGDRRAARALARVAASVVETEVLAAIDDIARDRSSGRSRLGLPNERTIIIDRFGWHVVNRPWPDAGWWFLAAAHQLRWHGWTVEVDRDWLRGATVKPPQPHDLGVLADGHADAAPTAAAALVDSGVAPWALGQLTLASVDPGEYAASGPARWPLQPAAQFAAAAQAWDRRLDGATPRDLLFGYAHTVAANRGQADRVAYTRARHTGVALGAHRLAGCDRSTAPAHRCLIGIAVQRSPATKRGGPIPTK